MKLKEKTKKRIQGSITVLMVIIMLPMMTMSAIIVDSSRINMARSMVSSSGDLAMNTALANYDTILKDVYGLFAMSQNKSDEELSNELKEYFTKTLVSYGVVNEAESGDYVDSLIGDFKDIIANSKSGKVGNFLDMNIVDFTAQKVDNSSLANSDIMRSQIVEYMKYRAPLNFGMSFLDSINAFKNVQSQTTVVQSQVAAQESTQDVTSACKTAIESIRTFDDLVVSIRTGDKAVKGKSHKSDNVTVDISEYHTQVDKYRSAWGDNYSHANKLNLVFLLKSPSVSSRYLKNLNVNSSQWFIKSDNSGIIYDNTGINVNPSLASSTGEAKNQVYSQINKLEDSNKTEKKTESAYRAKNFLDGSDKTLANGTTFTDEGKAIETFIAFENFLTDNGDVKYSNVKTTLESIYTLGRYYDNYNGKITTDIQNAQNAMNAANQTVSTANTNASTYYTNIDNNRKYINDANKNYTNSYEFLKDITNSDNENLQSVVSSLLAKNNISMPTGTTNKGGKAFTVFTNFVKNNYKENGGDSDNRFLKVFKEIAGSSLKDNEEYKDICNAATSYLKDKADKKTSKSFSEYVKSKAGSSSLNNDLYKLLAHLYKNSGYVGTIESNITKYNNVVNSYAGYVSDAQDKTDDYNNKVSEKNTVNADYKNCLSIYNSFVTNYQNDLVYYEKYITTAKAVITNEVVAVNNQFTKIKTNIKSIIDQLTVIETNLSTAWTAIDTYNDKLDSWKSANDTYVSSSGKDSFSQQNSADIEASKTQYNLSSLETLQAYVTSIKGEYQDFYDRITDGTHFKYGSKKIDTINTADLMKSAVPSSVKDSLGAVITVDAANSKLGELYNGEATGAIEMDNWYFLDPVLPIVFLKYLNETYPETAPSGSQSVQVDGSTISVGDGEGDFNYESTKSSLTSNSGGGISDDTDTDKFGYSYKGKSVDKTTVPSKDKGGKEGDANSKFNVGTKEDGDIDVSSGFSAQSSALGTILSGIGDVATNALENTYIMSYIFNNFSYNTLVQDEVLKKESSKVDGQMPFNAISTANGLFVSGNSTFDSVKDKTTTLSNYLKNKNNNYFYGAEIEYLLYGNGNAETNVKYTKASIYAIRFAFNCIYAFTNSEIRNSTMAVGLAVQAATCGFVPYQLVQIVLQLAMAAAESAVDLNMMNCGLKVAIVKTNDTWSLSISSAVKSAGQIVADVGADIANKAISSISSGLQGLVDAGADQLNASITDLSSNLVEATEGKLEEIVDGAFSYIQSKIEESLNELQYVDYNDANINATTVINNAFSKLESSLATELTTKFGGNPVADAILPHITSEISSILSSVKNDVNSKINGLSKDAIGEAIVSGMTDIKIKMIGYASNKIAQVELKFNSIVSSLTGDISSTLNNYIGQTAGEISEEVSETIKEEVTNATNDFISEYLDDGVSDAIGSGVGGSNSSSVASMIKFGYKDYLMLFVFISLCANPDNNPTIARIADMVEINIQKASGEEATGLQDIKGGTLKHKKGSAFKMADAKTYIAINANVKLDMLFMNMDLFANMVSDETDTEVSGQLTPAATIEYNGLYGY